MSSYYYKVIKQVQNMRPTIELELVVDPSIFPLHKDRGVPNRGLTTWFETQPDWYVNANYKSFVISTDGDEPVVFDISDDDENGPEPLPISGLVQMIWNDTKPDGWDDPQYTITHKSVIPPSLTEEQADLVDQVNVYLLGRHEEIAEEGGVWEEKDTRAVLDLMLQALGSSWNEFEQSFYA